MAFTSPESVGLLHWKQQNQIWRTASSSKAFQEETLRGQPHSRLLLDEKAYDHVFRKLVMDRQPLKTPLPLADAIPIMVHGWKQMGVWPTDYKAAKFQ